MSFADDIKPLLNSIRGIPGQFGLRPYSVDIVIRRKAGKYGLDGSASEVSRITLSEGGYPPKVRILNDEELALGGLGRGALQVGPITPDFLTGGASFAEITASAAQDHDLVHFEVTGPAHPNGARYRLIDAQSDRAMHWMLRLAPVASLPAVPDDE
jgi:hypothetical protein